ncbi:hypothetical protein CEP51_013944 [Fusarium floridanum]|uniref:SGNH hydrolase-type esterase domain-containing protein n=1 Tax=Fusarium floridanum TaxID=1325733 RepID=A0A428Q203_9HYPO|nr:hypothetical protein CEP51_013944 [Fusarium floridanum]
MATWNLTSLKIWFHILASLSIFQGSESAFALQEPSQTYPRQHARNMLDEPTWVSKNTRDLSLRSQASPASFRILGTGSSTSVGIGSKPVDGYRLELKNLLQGNGADVSFTGPFCNGTEGSNHAGKGGETIGQTKDRAIQEDGWKNFAPNVIIINAGSNNCADDGKLKEEPGPLMKELLDTLLQTPNTVILVSLVHQVRIDARNQCIKEVNEVIAEVANTYPSSTIRTVDLFNKLNLATEEYHDCIHVNNAGYKKMAKMYYDTLLDMDISEPSSDADPASCDASGSTDKDT